MHLTSKFLFNFICSVFLLRFVFKKRQDLLCILSSFIVNLRLLEPWLVRAFDEVISSLNSGRFLPRAMLRTCYFFFFFFLSAYTNGSPHLDITSDFRA